MNIIKKPTPLQIAQRELLEAEHALLVARSAQEYTTSMVDYHSTRIDRLTMFIELAGAKA